jgi:hypothetical protein
MPNEHSLRPVTDFLLGTVIGLFTLAIPFLIVIL